MFLETVQWPPSCIPISSVVGAIPIISTSVFAAPLEISTRKFALWESNRTARLCPCRLVWLGRQPFKLENRVRTPMGTPNTNCHVRLSVRTQAFQVCKTGSIPVRDANPLVRVAQRKSNAFTRRRSGFQNSPWTPNTLQLIRVTSNFYFKKPLLSFFTRVLRRVGILAVPGIANPENPVRFWDATPGYVF